MIRFKAGETQVALSDEAKAANWPNRCPAKVYGEMAVHRNVDAHCRWSEVWVVTHRRTGYSVARVEEERRARAIAAAVQDPAEGLNWAFGPDEPRPANWQEMGRKVHGIIDVVRHATREEVGLILAGATRGVTA